MDKVQKFSNFEDETDLFVMLTFNPSLAMCKKYLFWYEIVWYLSRCAIEPLKQFAICHQYKVLSQKCVDRTWKNKNQLILDIGIKLHKQFQYVYCFAYSA
jgi:hypothetical protein